MIFFTPFDFIIRNKNTKGTGFVTKETVNGYRRIIMVDQT